MAKLLHFSDMHFYGLSKDSESRLKAFDSVIDYANDSSIDTLVCTGDLLDGHTLKKAFPKEEQSAMNQFYALQDALSEGKLEKNDQTKELIEGTISNMKILGSKYVEMAAMFYGDFEKRVSKFNGNLEMVVGNHDAQGMEEIVKSGDFSPNDTFGKYFFQTGGPVGIPFTGLYGDSPDEYAEPMKNSKIGLWHMGPHSNKRQNFNIDERAPWTKEMDTPRIHLYGHEHSQEGFSAKYDANSDVLEVNVCSEKGVIAEITYDENTGSFEEINIYKIKGLEKAA